MNKPKTAFPRAKPGKSIQRRAIYCSPSNSLDKITLPSDVAAELKSPNFKIRRAAEIDYAIISRIRWGEYRERYEDRWGHLKECTLIAGEVMITRSVIAQDSNHSRDQVRRRVERLIAGDKLIFLRAMQAHNGKIYKANFFDQSEKKSAFCPTITSKLPNHNAKICPTIDKDENFSISAENKVVCPTTDTPYCPTSVQNFAQPNINRELLNREKEARAGVSPEIENFYRLLGQPIPVGKTLNRDRKTLSELQQQFTSAEINYALDWTVKNKKPYRFGMVRECIGEALGSHDRQVKEAVQVHMQQAQEEASRAKQKEQEDVEYAAQESDWQNLTREEQSRLEEQAKTELLRTGFKKDNPNFAGYVHQACLEKLKEGKHIRDDPLPMAAD